MKKLKKILIVAAVMAAVCLIFIAAGMQPVIRISGSAPAAGITAEQGAVIEPFKNLNITGIRIVFDNSDMISLNPAIKKARCLQTSDMEVIKAFKKLHFIYTGGDIATVGSKIYVYDGDKLVFESGIFLDDTGEGLQSGSLGYLEPAPYAALSKVCAAFKRCKAPVIFI